MSKTANKKPRLPVLRAVVRKFVFVVVTILATVLTCYFIYQYYTGTVGIVRYPTQIPPVQLPQNNLRMVLVLGGGGARGLAHVGVIEVFEQAGVPIDYIVGCSAGSLVGALYASEKSIQKVKDLLLPLKRDDLVDVDYTNLRYGLSNGTALTNFLTTNLPVKSFSELKIPLLVVATDLYFGQLIKINSGPLIPAVRASSALPLIYQPVEWEGRMLVDGGVLSPVPAQVARQMNSDLVVAVDVSELLPRALPTNLFGVTMRSMEITYAVQSKEGGLHADIVIKPKVGEIGILDATSNQRAYEAGRHAAELYLDVIKDRLGL